jgi:TonB-linked SusC/RagA family outer membrane protein
MMQSSVARLVGQSFLCAALAALSLGPPTNASAQGTGSAYQLAQQSNYQRLDAMTTGRTAAPIQLAQRVSLQRKRIPLQQALMEIASQAGMGLSYGEELTAARVSVTVDISNVTAAEAFAAAIRGTGWMLYVSTSGQAVVLRDAVSRRVAGAVAGSVVDAATGVGIATVTVLVEGTGLGATTDGDGNFRIANVPDGLHKISARRLGYAPRDTTVTVRTNEDATVVIRLVRSAVQLDEVVVSVSATDTKRASIGTDIPRLDVEDAIGKAATTNSLSDVLHSSVPGVDVNLPSGQVGAASVIRIRGINSLTQGTTPLVYVDGVRVSNNTNAGPQSFDFGYNGSQSVSRLNDINPSEIADIQVIKGPAATALYGSEAGVGVIAITTKRGADAGTKFTVQTEQSFLQDVANYNDGYYPIPATTGVTDVNDPRIQPWRPVRNPVTGEIFARANPLMNEATRPFRVGWGQNYSVEGRGGGERTKFYFSTKYDDKDGTLPNNSSRRLNLRANLDITPNEKLSISFSNGYVDSRILVPHNDHSALGMITNGSLSFPLYSYGALPDGSRSECLATVLFARPDSLCRVRQGNLSATFDKLATAHNEERLGRYIGSATAKWQPFEWLSTRLALGMDRIDTRTYQLVPLDPDRPFAQLSDGFITDGHATDRTYSMDYAASGTFALTDRLASVTTVGGQLFRKEYEEMGCTGSGFSSPAATACDASITFTGASGLAQSVERGGFVQQQFALNDAIFVTGALRVDENSGFGEQVGSIWSPSANASVVLSRMSFWKIDRISNFRLRAGWGKAAQAPSPYAYARTYRPVRVESGGAQLSGFTMYAPGNPDLTAERKEEVEVGFDIGMFDDRVTGTFTYFDQSTTGAIIYRRVAPSAGYEQTQAVNLGRLDNNGIEASLSAELLATSNVLWSVTLSASTQHPIVASLGGQPPSNSIREGYAPGYLSSPVVASAERDADGKIVPGSVVMATPNIAGTDRVYIGTAHPTNEQSLSSSATLFGRFRVSTAFSRAAGHYKSDGGIRYSTPFSKSQHVSEMYAMRHIMLSPEQQAALELGSAVNAFVFYDKGDFVRWRDLTVGIELPPSVLSFIPGQISSAHVTIGGQNLHTWTAFRGLDPEIRDAGGSNSFGTSPYFTQPPARLFFVRLAFGI